MKPKCGIRGRRFPAGLWLVLLAAAPGSVGALSPFVLRGTVQCDFWQTSDGLPNHDVAALAQTPEGYLWAGTIGSTNSLVRFNGFEFTPAVTLTGGAGNAPTCLAGGRDGRLWISRASGAGSLALWQGGKTTLVETRLPPPVERGIPLFEDRAGNLWIGGKGLLVRSAAGQVKDLGALASGLGEIRQMTEDQEGTLWLATGQGLVRHRHGVFDRPYPINAALFSVYSSRDGSLWLGTDTEPGLFQVTPSGTIVRYGENEGLDSRGVLAICEDSEANLWLGTYSGLYYAKDGRAYPIKGTNLRTTFIFSLLCDREGSLWAGTSDGLYRLHLNPIEHYGAADGLGSVSSLSFGPSGPWANIFSRGAYLRQGGVWARRLELDDASGDSQLFETSGGDVWLATEFHCWRHPKGKARVTEDIGGKTFFCEAGPTLWILNATNLFAFRDEKLTPMGEGWPAMNLTGVATNRGEGLLIGTTQGLYRWTGHLTRWLDFGRDFPGARVSGLDWEEGTLWLASDQAIARYRGQWQVIGPEAGLGITGGINSMLVESDSLWLGCANGLFRISRGEVDQYLQGTLRQLTLAQYGKAQGMRSGYLGPGAWGQGAVRGKDGQLWFASKSGVVGVNTKLPLNPEPPPVVIESVLLDQQPAADFSAHPRAPIQVPASARNVEIRYAALTYVAPTMTVYRYRLRGLDSDWSSAGNSRVARFTKLPPGNYEFQVQARHAGGVWNEQIAGVPLTQRPFFRQTRAFLVLCGSLGAVAVLLLAASVTAVAHTISTRKMRRRLALLEAQQALDRERARIARDIHDDVGSTLTRIVLLSELAGREPEQTFTPDGHLAGIRSAAREITRRLDEIVWAINPRNDTLDALVTYLSKLVTDQARAAGLRCRLDLPPSLPPWAINGNTRHNVFLACKEAIHNAIKHAAATQLRLRLSLEEEGFRLEISDDGVGLPSASPEPGGDGLFNLRERLAASGGTCEFSGGSGRGTVVSFRLPRPRPPPPLSIK